MAFLLLNYLILYYYFSHVCANNANNLPCMHLPLINSMDQIDYKNMGQIDHYQNMGTKLTMTPKYKDQNDIFANFLILSTTLDC